MNTITIPAYAKINLFLDIHSLRENGYHNIISIMQRVSLHDEITVSFEESNEKSVSVFCNKGSIPCDESNLAYKAAMLFPITGNIRIYIEKNIPVSAGLAGGSTDGAATLVALNTLTGNKLSADELCALGAKLGADLPFCIKGGACMVEGIGEILTPVSSMPSFPMVIAKMGEGMSTPAAYRALDVKYNNFEGYIPAIDKLEKLQKNERLPKAYCEGLYNVFESVVEPERPLVTKLKEIMLGYGADGAMMSGSGTSVFGIFEKECDAEKAKEALISIGAAAFVCYPV